MNGMYEELLEKLRKNNRMSGWTHIDRLMDDAIKAIEALQQENEQLKDENANLRNWNACEEELHNELLESDKRRWELELELEDANNYRAGLEAIVDKLRAHVARMREALECVESDFVDGVGIVACAFCGKENAKERGHQEFCVVGKALISIDATDYHNPADVEALRKAREALITTIKGIDNKKIIPANADAAIELWRHKQQISNALAAIDKAIGDETGRGKEG